MIKGKYMKSLKLRIPIAVPHFPLVSYSSTLLNKKPQNSRLLVSFFIYFILER